MKRFAKTILVVLMLCFATQAWTPLFAQEWSAAQKEVWKNVEAYWTLEMQGDLEGFMSYFHDDYRGWEYDSAFPYDKPAVRRFVGHAMQTTKTLVQEIKPVAIQIHGNVAFVDYYYDRVVKDAEGKEKLHSGRWTDILMKQGDRWVLIGDHGGETSVRLQNL